MSAFIAGVVFEDLSMTCLAVCRHLIAHPDIVANKSVLEIGAGCGVCGILAVKLKAREVM